MLRDKVSVLARHVRSVNGARRDSGFTLIELLVVVIIIGILAAIAIPVYIGVQNDAKDAAVKSDLANAQTALLAYYAGGGSTTVTTANAASLLGSYGYRKSGSVDALTVKPTPSSTSFCLSTKRSSDSSASTLYVTHEGTITTTAC